MQIGLEMADAFEAEVEPGSPVGGSPNSEDQNPMSIRDQDRFLPIANISRIMKRALPPNGKISKDAKEMLQECVSEFISFVTSEYVNSFYFFLFIYIYIYILSWYYFVFLTNLF